MRFIERSVFLRNFNYLRIEHGYYWQFHIVLPMGFSVVIVGLIFGFGSDLDIYGDQGLIARFSQLLAILAPFFIASLAAVATFAGNDAFNEKFNMAEPVTLKVLYRGDWIDKQLTLRQFLSLLFGYCSVSSLVLFMITLIGPVISAGVANAIGEWSHVAGIVFFVCFIFLFCHMITATLLGLYYLSDRMHRET